MKYIAVLVRTPYLSQHMCTIISELQKERKCSFCFILQQQKDGRSWWRERCYHFYYTIEKMLHRYTPHIELLKRTHISRCFPEIDIFHYNPSSSSEEVPEGIDLILTDLFMTHDEIRRCQKLSKEGLLHIRYSDTRELSAPVVAFYEVYRRKDSIGFTITLHRGDDEETLFRGEIATLRTVVQTHIRLLRESKPYLLKIINDYLDNREFRPLEKIVYAHKPSGYPSPVEITGYIFKTVSLFTTLLFKRVVLRQHPRFAVAFLHASWENAHLHKGIEITNPPGHFFADPFVWIKDGRTVCFVEDYSYEEKIAWISAIELFPDNSYKILGEVIREPFHMSFPYLFTYNDTLYMIPETTQNGDIRLYKCISFPMKWEYQHSLMEHVRSADTMVFAFENRWWMLTNMSTAENEDQAAQLSVFYSDSPLSRNWKPHRENPVCFSSNFGRNGGIILNDDKLPIRGRQKQRFNVYGAELSLARITALSPQSYHEEHICDIRPDFFEKIRATHHIHSHRNVTVYDFMRYEGLK